MSLEEIRNLLMEGVGEGYSHLIIFYDEWEYNDYGCYVSYDEDVNEVIEDRLSYGMCRVMEVYNYNLDLESQLEEERAYHIDPIIKINCNINPKIKKAFLFAQEKHKNQRRKNGKPYVTHPLNVLDKIIKYKKSHNIDTLIISALLHDTLEDTNTTYYELVNNFGQEVASLVLELTTDKDMKEALGKEKYLEIKMKNMSSWALDIKLCDRLDNINDLASLDNSEFKNRYINETINILLYLIKNAKLTQTHLNIIKDIIISLNSLCNLSTNNNLTTVDLYYQNLLTLKNLNSPTFENNKSSSLSRKLIEKF